MLYRSLQARIVRRAGAAGEPLERRALLSAAAAEVAPTPAAGPVATPPSGVVKVLSNVTYRRAGGHAARLDVYEPEGPAPGGGRPAVVAIPGGGWRWASKEDYGASAAQLARYGFVVVAVDYAFSSPGVRSWPANLDDVREAVRWVRRNADRLHVDPGRIAAMGESSGAHLASLVGTYPDGPVLPSGLPADPPDAPAPGVSARVQAVVDFYGPADLRAEYRDVPRVRPWLASFLGGTPDRVPGRYLAASPVAHVTPDDPPFLIFQGEADTIVPDSQSIELDHALAAAGVPHQFVLLPTITHGFRFQLGPLDLRPQVVAFLDAALGTPPATA